MIRLNAVKSDKATPFLNRLEQGLTNRTDLHGYIGGREEQLFQEHVRREAPKRHKTADRLGARRTGHLERASQSIEGSGSATAAIIAFPRSTGLSRAFRSYTLTPKNGSKNITLPVHPLAYGRSIRDFSNIMFINMRGTLVAARRVRGQEILETLYVLKPKVTVPQDRSLLPSDEQILLAAELGARDYIKDLENE